MKSARLRKNRPKSKLHGGELYRQRIRSKGPCADRLGKQTSSDHVTRRTCLLLKQHPSRTTIAFGLIAALAACGDDNPADSSAHAVPTDAPPNAGPAPTTVAVNASGEAICASNCIACHQANGQGLSGAFPPLAGSEWVTGSADRPIAVVLHGLQGPITVAGKKYNGVMMAGGTAGAMDDQQIADVLSYVRSSWGNTASAVTAADVARVRAAYASRTSAWTAAELQALP